MRYLICLGRTMIWNTVSGQCAMENDALPGDEEPLPRWWCVALCACSPLSHYNGSVFYHELWPSLIWRRGTVCGSNSPFGARHGANSCVSVKIPQPTWRRWRRSCSRQACHPRKKPSGQRCRLSRSGPVLFEGSEQGLALVTKTKARELLAVSDGGLPSQLSPAGTVKPSGALLQVLLVSRILLPPGRVGHTAPVAQQIRVPVLAATDTTILRFEPANAALHIIVGAGKVLPVVALHQVRKPRWRARVRTR